MPKKKKAQKSASKKAKKSTARRKLSKPAKKIKKAKAAPKKIQAVKAPKEKLLGRVEHYFDKIMVAAVGVKAPFAVGDILHIKGHTTDFAFRLESMQIEHQNVTRVKKGDDVGIKVKAQAREHDLVYLSDEKALRAQPVSPAKAKVVQQPMFPALDPPKTAPAAPAKPLQPGTALPPQPAQPKPQADTYNNKKFFSF
ncbi:MAG: hypothetical protein JW873_01350 [Candidatus Saganbacteria bacterium]|nr:hypothetical protein [Candidatus Saganbacteria bacterium]